MRDDAIRDDWIRDKRNRLESEGCSLPAGGVYVFEDGTAWPQYSSERRGVRGARARDEAEPEEQAGRALPASAWPLAGDAPEVADEPGAAGAVAAGAEDGLEVAAGLHDCGKVTTPEYVVDKATKLETIYNRIHEIRMRFEVVKRDTEIAYLTGVLAGGDPDALAAERDARLQQLDDDFAFVAECNVGGEFMAPDKIERVKKIAETTWVRTLDDTHGLAWEEKARKMAHAVPAPAVERLLEDKPEHVIAHSKPPIGHDNPWGFKIPVPEQKFNLGEVYNLAISRGTLTAEDRFHINDHIVQTIIMLESLPLPRNLRRVPEIAGGHHEKMDGSGYPKGLKRDEMSIPARMMAIADIFEALTARDRPYKPAKKLSEALKIMSFMVKDRHIDPDLFEFFLTSGVYRNYAELYLMPEQLDEIDIANYLPKAAQ